MKHLIFDPIYMPHPNITSMIQADGVELLTDYDTKDVTRSDVVSVHLPYAIDWYGIYSGKRKKTDEVTGKNIIYMYYGLTKDEMVKNIHAAISSASFFNPAYGVLHASSTNFDEMGTTKQTETDKEILTAFAELVNQAVSLFPNGEPPFKILFENLWWPGLKLLDNSGFEFLEKKIEFENWGICMDTGHLLVATKQSTSEEKAIELLQKITDGYSKDLIDSIKTVHLHLNTSAEYIKNFKEPEGFYDRGHMARYKESYEFIPKMDEHRPFTDKSIVDIMEKISPDFINHEMDSMIIEDRVRNYNIQRSLF